MTFLDTNSGEEIVHVFSDRNCVLGESNIILSSISNHLSSMVVLSIAIVSKSGRVHLSRQYVEMTRIRIEGILAAFPKLVDEGTGKQHTYIETGSIRYVYQPLEGMYVVLVTTRGSNIVQDLETLRLVSKVIPEYAQVTEEDIRKNVFDLVFAFDEVVTLGYKENITVQQIRTNLEMESHEEKLHLMIKQSKMNEAKDEARRQAAHIKARKLQGMSTGTMVGIGNTPGQGTYTSVGNGLEGGGGGAPSFSSSDTSKEQDRTSSSSRYGVETAKPSMSGLKIGKGLKVASKTGKGLSMMQQMAKEEGIDADALVQQKTSASKTAVPGAVVRSDPYEVRVSESITVVYDKDGALNKIEVKGAINLTCREDDSKVRLDLEYYGPVDIFNFTPHPNLSKPDFLENKTLQMKNPEKAFPKDKALAILKWRYAAKEDEAEVPLKVTCWPESNGDGTITVNMEAELLSEHYTLHNVLITIPLGTSEAPEISSCDDNGVVRHIAKKHSLEWELQSLDKNNKMSQVEFIVSCNDEAAFFPVTVQFFSEDTVCPVHVPQVSNVDTNEPVKFGLYRQLTTERYEVVETE